MTPNTLVIEDLKKVQDALDDLDFWLIGFDNGLVDASSARQFAAETPRFFELCRVAQRHLEEIKTRPAKSYMVSYIEETERMLEDVVCYVVNKLAVFGLMAPGSLAA